MATRGFEDYSVADAMRLGRKNLALPPPKLSKYRNQRTPDPISGQMRDSGLEARHSFELEMRQRAGEIRGLQRQINYALVVCGIHICDYRADFVFEEHGDGDVWNSVVADSKSPPTRKTQNYRIKFKLMQACQGITIREMC